MYDIDLFDNNEAVVRALHTAGRKVVCYMNAGGWEEWRPDASQFPNEVIGGDLDEEPVGVGSPNVIPIGVASIPSSAHLVIHGGKLSDVEVLRSLAERQSGHVVAMVDGEGMDFVW